MEHRMIISHRRLAQAKVSTVCRRLKRDGRNQKKQDDSKAGFNAMNMVLPFPYGVMRNH